MSSTLSVPGSVALSRVSMRQSPIEQVLQQSALSSRSGSPLRGQTIVVPSGSQLRSQSRVGSPVRTATRALSPVEVQAVSQSLRQKSAVNVAEAEALSRASQSKASKATQYAERASVASATAQRASRVYGSNSPQTRAATAEAEKYARKASSAAQDALRIATAAEQIAENEEVLEQEAEILADDVLASQTGSALSAIRSAQRTASQSASQSAQSAQSAQRTRAATQAVAAAIESRATAGTQVRTLSNAALNELSELNPTEIVAERKSKINERFAALIVGLTDAKANHNVALNEIRAQIDKLQAIQDGLGVVVQELTALAEEDDKVHTIIQARDERMKRVATEAADQVCAVAKTVALTASALVEPVFERTTTVLAVAPSPRTAALSQAIEAAQSRAVSQAIAEATQTRAISRAIQEAEAVEAGEEELAEQAEVEKILSDISAATRSSRAASASATTSGLATLSPRSASASGTALATPTSVRSSTASQRASRLASLRSRLDEATASITPGV